MTSETDVFKNVVMKMIMHSPGNANVSFCHRFSVAIVWTVVNRVKTLVHGINARITIVRKYRVV